MRGFDKRVSTQAKTLLVDGVDRVHFGEVRVGERAVRLLELRASADVNLTRVALRRAAPCNTCPSLLVSCRRKPPVGHDVAVTTWQFALTFQPHTDTPSEFADTLEILSDRGALFIPLTASVARDQYASSRGSQRHECAAACRTLTLCR